MAKGRKIMNKGNKGIFTKIYFGLAYSYDRQSRGRVDPLYFDMTDTKLIKQEFLRILEKESLANIRDFIDYGLMIENMIATVGGPVEKIRNRLRKAAQLGWEQSIRDGKEGKRVDDLIEKADIYAILEDPHIWQRQRHMGAIFNLIRDVLTKGKAAYYISNEEEVEFNQNNLDFRKIEKICYMLIKAGWIKEGIYILEAMRERITDPLIKGMVFFYHNHDNACEIFRQHKKEIKVRLSRWFR